MMREFQAENDRHQTTIENNLTALINATADHVNVTATANDQSSSTSTKQQETSDNHSNQMTINLNTTERRSVGDQNKLTSKTINRLISDSFKVIYDLFLNFFIYFVF
jgi:hypothetical protein